MDEWLINTREEESHNIRQTRCSAICVHMRDTQNPWVPLCLSEACECQVAGLPAHALAPNHILKSSPAIQRAFMPIVSGFTLEMVNVLPAPAHEDDEGIRAIQISSSTVNIKPRSRVEHVQWMKCLCLAFNFASKHPSARSWTYNQGNEGSRLAGIWVTKRT
jgi:hypothetical protein